MSFVVEMARHDYVPCHCDDRAHTTEADHRTDYRGQVEPVNEVETPRGWDFLSDLS